MKITHADVVVTGPGRNFVTLVLRTDDGLTGLGDATLNGRELAVASYLTDHVVPLLIGRDATRIEDTWQFLYRGAYWRRGAVTAAATSAVDTALWDIAARAADVPLYRLLGGASRTGALAYGHASGRDVPELLDSVRAHLEAGYRAIRVQTGVPGLDTVYGVAASAGEDRYDYEPARRQNLPVEEVWDTRAYLRHVPTVLDAVRAEFGPELPLLHDGHHRMTPREAAQLGKSLEPHDLFWLEDVTPAEDPAALRLVRQHSCTPLAIGEVFTSVHEYTTLLSERLIDYVRSAVTHAGGVTGMRKLLDFASVFGVRSGMHGPTDISPVGMAAALHLDIAIHNFGIQEYMRHAPETLEVFGTSYTFVDGLLHPSDETGLGVTLDTRAAAAHPYVPAYLPINRLRDGTMHDW